MKEIIAQAQFSHTWNEFDLTRYLNTINEMVKNTEIKRLAIAKTDMIFSLIDAQHFEEICNKVLTNVQLVLYQPAQVIKDENEIMRIIKENHVTLLGGHVGISKLLEKLRRNYYWINMKSTISNFIKSCLVCK